MAIQILDKLRSKYPQYANVDDAELTKALVSKYPQYLDDPELRKAAGPMLGAPVISSGDVKPAPGVSTIAGGPPNQFNGSVGETLQDIYQTASTPFVPLPKFTVNPDDSKLKAGAKAAANLAIGLPEFVESPLGIATAGAATAFPRAVAGLFLADTTRNTAQAATDMGANWDQMTDAQKTEAIVGLGGQTLLAAALAQGTGAGKAIGERAFPNFETVQRLAAELRKRPQALPVPAAIKSQRQTVERAANPGIAPETAGGMMQSRPVRATDPVPSTPASIEAQAQAALDPNQPRAVVLQTPGEVAPNSKLLTPISTEQGTAWVNPEKVDPAEAKAALDTPGGGGTLLGMASDTKPADGNAVVTTRDAAGTPVLDEVVNDQTLPAAVEKAKATGNTVEVRRPQDVIAERRNAPLTIAETQELASLKKKDLTDDGLDPQETQRLYQLSNKETRAKRQDKTNTKVKQLNEAGVSIPDDFLNPNDGTENHITDWTRDKNGYIQIRVENHDSASMRSRLITVKPGDVLNHQMDDSVPGTTRYIESNPSAANLKTPSPSPGMDSPTPRPTPPPAEAAPASTTPSPAETPKGSGFIPPPFPEKFDSLESLIKYRADYKAAEIQFYKSLGLTDKEAEKMFRAGDARSNLDVSAIEDKLSPENRDRLDKFSTGEGQQMYSWDKQYNPEEMLHETDKSELAIRVVQNLSREDVPTEFGDKLIHAAIALRQLKNVGGTWSDIARALDKHTTAISGSQFTKGEVFKIYGEKIKEFAAAQGINFEAGELGNKTKPISAPAPALEAAAKQLPKAKAKAAQPSAVPAKTQVDPKTDELLGTNNRGEPIYWSNSAKTHYSISQGKVRTAPWVEGLSEPALERLDNLISGKTSSPAAAAAKVQEHVTEVATGEKRANPEPALSSTTGPRAAKEIKSELVQRLEELAAKVSEPEFTESKPVTYKGKKEFNMGLGDVIVNVRESKNGTWDIIRRETSGKDGSVKETVLGNTGYWANITEAKRVAGAILEELVYPGRSKTVTVEIPGDGTFTIKQTYSAINRTLERAKKLSTSTEPPKGYTESLPSREQGRLWMEEARVKEPPTAKGSSLAASTAGGVVEFPKLMGGVDAIRPMETPEILRLARDFAGSTVAARKLADHLRGVARGKNIDINQNLFADPQQVAMTLAHELGHVNDFMPEGTLKRGNILGRLVGSVHQFLKGSFGGLNNAELRTELKALSAFWRPWNEATASKSQKAYRNSAKELYADAISVLLNSPGLLEQKAPKFYKAFFEHLDRKPKFKQEFFALQDLLSRGQEAVLGERSQQTRENFEKGEQLLHEKLRERESARNSFKDFLTKVRSQSLDMADYLRRKLGGDAKNPTEFDRLYEEWRLEDNKNSADVQRIYHDMIQPLLGKGVDEVTFGQVLQLQRIAGGIEAYKDMQAMRKALGPQRLAVLQAAEARLAELERKGVAEEQAIEQVAMPLEAAGIPFEMVDQYRQLRSGQGTRAELANEQGRSPIMAEAELNHLLGTLNPEQRAAVLEASQKFRNLIFERVTEARDVGIINKLTYDNVIVPNKDTYAAFRPLDKIDTFVSPMVRKAKGSLGDMENPFITSLLKLVSLNNLIETQRLKNSVRDQMTALFPGEFTKAETRWTGKRMEAVPPKPNVGRLGILENGRLVQYDVDPWVGKMFEHQSPKDAFWLNKLLEVPFRMGIYPLIIKYNPGFLFAFNPRRDMARTVRNLYAVEGVTRRELLPNYADPEVLKAVNDYLHGRPNALANEMIRNKAIGASWEGFAKLDQEDVLTDLLRRYKLAKTPEGNQAVRTLMWLPDKISQGGSYLEALPKFAAYRTLIQKGVGPERASWIVRNYAGTPNFRIRGLSATAQNSYLPFINIFLQGWRADLKLATSPKTAGGWWMQWALQHGWQAVLVGLATAGVFGDDLRKKFARISEYDKTNYGVLPLGETAGGDYGNKTAYIRFPRDETSRLFGGITYKLTRYLADKAMKNPERPAGLPTELFAFGAGVTPSPTPILQIAGAWKDYASGLNPQDPFRNRPVMSQRDFNAGGTVALGDMMKFTLGQSGLLNLIMWNPKAETTTELTVSATPIVNRLMKVSDAGLREEQLNSEAIDARDKARLRIQYGNAAQTLVAQHDWLQKLGEKRTAEQSQKFLRIHAWKTALYDKADEAAWNAREHKDAQRGAITAINTTAEQVLKSLQK